MARPPFLRLSLAALLGALALGSALAAPRRNFPLGIAVSPQGDLALVGNEERAGEVVSLPDLKLVRVLEAEKGSYVRWHPSQPRVALFSAHLWVYSTDPWRLVHHSVAAFADVVFHGEKNQLIGLQQIADEQYALMVSDLETNPTMSTFPIADRKPNRILYMGQNQVLVLGRDGFCSLWDLGTRTAVATMTFEGMRGPLAVDAYLSPERRLAAWVSQDTGRAGLFTVPTMEEVHTFQAHKKGYAEALRFSPDGKQLATGAGYPESIVKLWDVEAGTALGKKTGVQALDIGWSRDGQTLFLCDRRLEQASTAAVADLLKKP